MAQITIQPKPITVEVPGYELISIEELTELRKKADFDRWWTPKDLKERYGHDLKWFKEKIFFNPKYDDGRLNEFIKFPKGKGSTWQFEPKKMARFMERNFEDVVA